MTVSDRKRDGKRFKFSLLRFICTWMFLWALLFGFTINGTHHEVSCSCNKGVEVTP